MNVKREAIALAVQLLADKTTLVRKPDQFELFLNSMFGQESYDQQLAREIESNLDRAVAAAKRCNTNRKFKKIIQNV